MFASSWRRILVFAALVAAVPVRDQQPTFRAASELTQVHAVVTDKSDAPAGGLTRDDFVVTEDGVRQEIAQFAFVDIPPSPEVASRGKASGPEPVTSVNNTLPRGARLYGLVLDAFHVDSSRSTKVRNYARQFINESIGPDDVAAVRRPTSEICRSRGVKSRA